MRYGLNVDFEDDADIESFLKFIQYHSKRLKCPPKDVFIALSKEWENQMKSGVAVEPEPKKPRKRHGDNGPVPRTGQPPE